MTPANPLEEQAESQKRLVFGLTLVLVGTALLLDRLSAIDINRHYWPFIPLFIGIVKLLVPSRSGQVARSRRSGAWFIFIGLWGLVSEFHVFGLYYDTSWPLFIIGFGLMVVWRSFEGPDQSKPPRPGPVSGVRTVVNEAREVVERVSGRREGEQ